MPDQPEYRRAPQRVVAVDDAYLAAQASVVRERLKMAGVRLGAILNIALRRAARDFGSVTGPQAHEHD